MIRDSHSKSLESHFLSTLWIDHVQSWQRSLGLCGAVGYCEKLAGICSVLSFSLPPSECTCFLNVSPYLHHSPLQWRVKYQPVKVREISNPTHDCFSNCSSFSRLQGLNGAPGSPEPGSDKQGLPLLQPNNPLPKCVSVCMPKSMCVCRAPGVTPHFAISCSFRVSLSVFYVSARMFLRGWWGLSRSLARRSEPHGAAWTTATFPTFTLHTSWCSLSVLLCEQCHHAEPSRAGQESREVCRAVLLLLLFLMVKMLKLSAASKLQLLMVTSLQRLLSSHASVN